MKKIVIIGGSAGSFKLVSSILMNLPADYPLPLFICMHRLRTARNGFREALSINSSIEILEPMDREKIKPSAAYIAPANYHLLMDHGHQFSLSVDDAVNHSRPSIDLTMRSAAEIFREQTIGILLSGANMDGAYGLEKIKDKGGWTIAQDPETAEIKTMPEAAIKLFQPDMILDIDGIINYLLSLNN